MGINTPIYTSITGDLDSLGNVLDVIYNVQPEEIYHLAAQSHVRVSFDLPEYTANITGIGTLRLLEAHAQKAE